MARSLLLAGELSRARAAAERSIEICERERWNAFLPWPQALRAHRLAACGDWSDARDDAEQSYAWRASWAIRAGREWRAARWPCSPFTRATPARPASGSSTPAGAVTGCPTGTSGDLPNLGLVQSMAGQITNPALHARAAALV